MTDHKKGCRYHGIVPASACPCDCVKPKSLFLEWEEIKQNHAGTLYRAKVPNGWLIKEVQDVLTNVDGVNNTSGYQWTSSITFVPDFEHLWVI